MANKLQVYNDALLAVKAPRIKALTDNRSERRAIDAVWAQTVKYMLEKGLWNFAARSVQLDPDTSVELQYGWQFAYAKPSDYRKLIAISDSERFEETPGLKFYEEYGAYWLSDATPIYVLYVSDDAAYGSDVGKWPEHFATAVSLELAKRAGPNITNMKIDERNGLMKASKTALVDARGFDASNQPPVQQTSGRLVYSRGSGRSSINAQRKAGYIRG